MAKKKQNSPPSDAQSDFADQASADQVGIIREFWDFLRYNKKWWLTPIILVLLTVGGFVIFASTNLPFIYALF